jgi:predicted dehydrogenase
VGVAGLGFGAAVHVPGLRGIPGVEVVAVAGTGKDRAAETAARLAIAHACGSIEEMLDLPLDAVSLALPPDEGERALALVLDRRLPVLAEKPLGVSATNVRTLGERAVGLTTAVDFEIPETATFTALKGLVAGGDLGRPRRIDVHWRMRSSGRRPNVWSWKLDARRGGGVVALLGSHLLHLVEWAIGPVERVSAALGREKTAAMAPPTAEPAEESADIELSGEGFELIARLDNAWEGPAGHEWTVTFERGRAMASNAGPDALSGFSLTVVPDGEPARVVARETPAAGDGRIAPFRALAARFVEAARQGRPTHPDLAAGARVQRLMEAIASSAASAQAVRV